MKYLILTLSLLLGGISTLDIEQKKYKVYADQRLASEYADYSKDWDCSEESNYTSKSECDDDL